MNARELTDGGLISTQRFWEVSIPVTIASIVIPIAFSGLLIRIITKWLRMLRRQWLVGWPFYSAAIFLALNVASAVLGGRTIFWILWTANLLYTMSRLRNAPAHLYKLHTRIEFMKRARAADQFTRMKTPEPADQSAQSVVAQTSMPRESASSDQRTNSWETIQSSHNEDTILTLHPSATEGNSDLSQSTDPSMTERNSKRHRLMMSILRKVIRWSRFLVPLSVLTITAGSFILGTVFLVLDILHHPKSRASLSIYHSFALWMSLCELLLKVIGLVLRRVLFWSGAYAERRAAQKTWSDPESEEEKRRRRSSKGEEYEREDGNAGIV